MYISVEEFKQYHPEVDTSRFNDTTISGMISRASRRVDKIVYGTTGIDLNSEVRTDELIEGSIDPDANLVIFPKKYPIISLQTVTLKIGTWMQDVTLEDGSGNKYYDIPHPGWLISFASLTALLSEGFPTMTFNALDTLKFYAQLDYTAGYTTIPDDIKEAAGLIAKTLIGEQHNEFGASEWRQGNLSVKYNQKSKSQELAEDILAPYKRII